MTVGGYLLDLADECRQAMIDVGLELVVPVHEVNRWEFTARSSGPYAYGRPSHLMFHHTASPPSWDRMVPMRDGQVVPRDVQFMLEESGARPVANLFIRREPNVEIWVMAGGATNTNGKGQDWWGGGVPKDDMNREAIGVECGNNGVGERWGLVERVMQALGIRFARTDSYSIPLDHLRAHWEYTTTRPGPFPPGSSLPSSRKIDGAGPNGGSEYAWPGDSAGRFAMDRYRGDAAAWRDELDPGTPKGDKMAAIDPLRILDATVPANAPTFVDPTIAGRPAWAKSAYINITVAAATAAGHTVAWPGGEPMADTSNNNFAAGVTDSNAALVKLNADGWFAIQPVMPGEAEGQVRLIVDLQGWGESA